MSGENETTKEIPTLTIELLDPLSFKISIDYKGMDSMNLCRAMLNEATKTIEQQIADQDAINFAHRMQGNRHAAEAMRNGAPRIKM